MFKKIYFGLFFMSSFAFADPTVFGLTLGKTTNKEVESKYSIKPFAENKYSNGNMYEIPMSQINFDGLQKVTLVFDRAGVLELVLAQFPKNKFDSINSTLKGKYKFVNGEIPHVGNKWVKYKDGNSYITLDAPHMSFDMDLEYITDDFLKSIKKQRSEENNKKSINEKNQL
ncbi:hypothetical protein [Serratia proteamaculans]|uniref:hypothetical protein n=1 Tax=Serratia proteamaculans TaxID=28151 RepID=UPI000A154DFD|nr:hypothetical protein [Serratia proteamaculans]